MSAVAAPAAAVRRRPAAVAAFLRASRTTRMRIGMGLTGAIVLIALVGPLVVPHSPSALVGAPYSPPTSDALLGTDYLGHDVLSRVLYGGRSVLWMAVSAALLGLVLGVAIGMFAGYLGSRSQSVVMGALDVILAFPNFVLPILFVSILGPKPWLIVLLVGLTHSPRVARLARATTTQIISREFVQVCELIGVPRWRILTQEVLPNITTPLMVEFGIRLTWSIAIIAGISFLGFGVQPPAADWGLMINENRNGFAAQPLSVVPAIVCIAVLTIGTNLMTEGFARAVAGIGHRTRRRR